MEIARSIKAPSAEVALRSAGAEGLTVREIMAATDLPETTVRRQVADLQGRTYKVPTMEGAKIIWGTKPAPASKSVTDPTAGGSTSPRRKEAYERDKKVLEVLRVNTVISCGEIARIIEAPDIDDDGWSQLTWLSLRRLRKRALCQREVHWKYLGPVNGPEDET
jgi:hypothetical protein